MTDLAGLLSGRHSLTTLFNNYQPYLLDVALKLDRVGGRKILVIYIPVMANDMAFNRALKEAIMYSVSNVEARCQNGHQKRAREREIYFGKGQGRASC